MNPAARLWTSSIAALLIAATASHPLFAAPPQDKSVQDKPAQDKQAPDKNAPVNSMRELAPKIGACWRAPHTDDQVTIKLSFTREGTLIGRPRVTFMKVSGKSDTDTEVELANSILKAVYDCTPLKFTPEFGASIAGRVLAIRFIAPPAPSQKALLPSSGRHA